MSQKSTVAFHSGVTMPQLGFGVWQVPDDAAEVAVGEALTVGYRSIDTAQMYRNESGVGRAIAAADVDRSDIFLTTKLNNDRHGFDKAQRAFDESVQRLQADYVDLFLIHWPLPAQDKFVETWRAMIELQHSGRTRSIGVSNFTIEYGQRLIDETGVAPAINQIELHPYFQQAELRAWNSTHGIATEAWSPLGQGGAVLADPVIVEIAARHQTSTAQIVIAWHLAIGNVVIPKSVTPSRIAENFASTEITLTAEDLAAIAQLDRADGRIGPDPVTVSA